MLRYEDRPAEEWSPLFWRVLRSQIVDTQRRRGFRLRWLAPADADGREPDWADDGPDPARRHEGREAWTRRAAGLERLPRRQREAFTLRVLEELDVAETALAMGCSEGSVKTHLSRARQALQRELEDWTCHTGKTLSTPVPARRTALHCTRCRRPCGRSGGGARAWRSPGRPPQTAPPQPPRAGAGSPRRRWRWRWPSPCPGPAPRTPLHPPRWRSHRHRKWNWPHRWSRTPISTCGWPPPTPWRWQPIAPDRGHPHEARHPCPFPAPARRRRPPARQRPGQARHHGRDRTAGLGAAHRRATHAVAGAAARALEQPPGRPRAHAGACPALAGDDPGTAAARPPRHAPLGEDGPGAPRADARAVLEDARHGPRGAQGIARAVARDVPGTAQRLGRAERAGVRRGLGPAG